MSKRLRFATLVFDEELTYSLCSGNCPQDEQAAGCHADCYFFVPDNTTRLAIIKATKYEFEPLSIVGQRRVQWLLPRWTCYIQSQYHLPTETCSQIAQNCLSHFAITYTILCLDARPETRPVRISRLTFASYVNFEGTWYMSSISNEQDDSAYDKKQTLVNFFVSEDHLGIRGFCEDNGSLNQGERAGVWWRQVQYPLSPASLWAASDVSAPLLQSLICPHSLTKYLGREASTPCRRFSGNNSILGDSLSFCTSTTMGKISESPP